MLVRLIYTVVGLLGWGGALLGALQLRHIQALETHSICNSLWGCGPPMNEIICWHAVFGLILLMPFTLGLIYLPLKFAKPLFFLTFWVGIASLLGYLVWDTGGWFYQQDFQHANLLHQRALFGIVTKTDLPLVQVVSLALFGVIGCRIKAKRQRHKLALSKPPQEKLADASIDLNDESQDE